MDVLKQFVSRPVRSDVKVSVISKRGPACGIVLVCVMVCVQWLPLVQAGEDQQPTRIEAADEYAIKSAFLLNFARFAKWPREAFASKDSSFRIGVLNHDPFVGALDQLVGEKVHGRQVEVVLSDTIEQMRACHLVFLNSSHELRIKSLLQALRGAPVLTVGERTGFCRWGGMLEFVMDGKRVRFNAAAGVARSVGLKLSSQLLDVAKELVIPVVAADAQEGGE
ncbi:MAG: YfiR family protein [Kiritimatiellae bacterium]|nr:YfiR family protein [Kiritimatiellia bacterium]